MASLPISPASSPAQNALVISDWLSLNKNTLVGVFTVSLPSGLVIVGCMLHRNTPGEDPWVALPSSVQLEKDGTAKRSNDGKICYKTIIRFRSRDLYKRFQEPIVEELKRLGHI